ncbi:uncharacterized protein LOC129909621 [Episyrphus balteatus]|uniref:uncharacterized protein LOC129909621 n=1 Tax=Episyrphus balteatus TaxID=286459 RepID=UPI002485AA49|nr:uncharacterized protein LOC129909621 [Episyrphus balteatus]
MKDKIKTEFENRLKHLLKTKLSSGNLIKAINVYAISALSYSFGLIKWSETDLDALERRVRTTMTSRRYHHPGAAKERLCLSRTEGGQGVIDIHNLHHKQVENLRRYFYERADIDNRYEILVHVDRNYTPLNLNVIEFQPISQIRNSTDVIDLWKQKPIHGKYPHYLGLPCTDKEASTIWLKKGELFPETEGFIMAIQDEVISTRQYQRAILHQDISSTCRRCHQTAESIDHIINGCSTLASSDYLSRHNNVAKIIHQELAFRCQFIDIKTPYYRYQPNDVLLSSAFKLYWDRIMTTDHTIMANRPDIIWIDKLNRKGFLIDIAVPLSSNASRTFAEKIAKYVELAHEIKAREKLKEVRVVPIIISSTGIFAKTVTEELKNIGCQQLIHEISKSVILSTCRIVRKFLQQS